MEESILKKWWEQLGNALGFVQRRIKEVDSWDGSPSNYSSTDAYCRACLIDVNSAAGREEKAQSHCKLPVREEGDSADTFVRQAIFAAAGGRGITQVSKPDDVPQEAWDRAIESAARQLERAYNEMDMPVPESIMELTRMKHGDDEDMKDRALLLSDVYEKMIEPLIQSYPDAFVHDLFMDDNQDVWVLFNSMGRLQKAQVMVENDNVMLGETIPVVMEFVEVPRSRTIIHRQADGKVRWFSISATNVLNKSGEIDSGDLFDSFVSYIDRTKDYPYRTIYHIGKPLVTGQCDRVFRVGNCLVTSGLYNNTDIAKAEIKAIEKDPDFWGESIGYLPSSNPLMFRVGEVDIPVYTSGRLVEISTLPESDAANLFTKIVMEERSKMPFSEKQWETLDIMIGDNPELKDKLKEFEQDVDKTNRSIEEADMITRNDEDSETNPVQDDIVIDDALVNEIATRAVQQLEATIKERFDELEQSNNQLVATLEDVVRRIETNEVQIRQAQRDDKQRVQEIVDDMPSHSQSKVRRITYRPSQNEPLVNGEDISFAKISDENLKQILGGAS